MVHKIYFILFFSIVGYVGGGVFSPRSYAASVIDTAEKKTLSTLTPPNTVNKKNPPSEQIIETKTLDTLYFPSLFIQLSNFTHPLPKPSNKVLKKPTDKKSANNVMLYPSLYAQTKEFLKEHKNNELLQDSFIAFSQTRRFLKEIDLMLHNLTQNILLSLNLDSSDQEGVFLLSQEDAPTEAYSAKTSFKQQIEIRKLQSFRPNSNKEKFTYSDNDLLALLFNMQNLYYFVGIVFLFFILKKTLKLVFLKDQYDSHNRR